MFAERQVVIVRLYVASGTESVGRVVLQLLQVSCGFNLNGKLAPGASTTGELCRHLGVDVSLAAGCSALLRLSGWLCDVRFPMV